MASIPPQRRLTGDAPAEFMETRMALPEGLVFSQGMDRFLPEADVEEQAKKVEALWLATIEDRNSLFKAMKQFQDKLAKKEPSMAKVDLRTCTWPEVQKEFERAKEYYKVERRKGAAGAIYTCFRKLGENSDMFAMWLNLLPDGDYGSGICGAFKLILGAAGRMDKIRTSIYQALQDIPEAVSKAQRYVKIYSDVKAYQLSQKTAVLFSSVLNALEKIITVLTEPGWKRAGKAFFQGDGYSDSIIESIEKVKMNAIEINREAEICAEARLRKMDENLAINDQRTQHIQHTVERYFQFLLASPALNPNTRQPYPMIQEDIPVKARKRRKLITKDADQPKQSLTVPQIFSMLNYNHLVSTADRTRCRLDGQQMSLPSKDRVSYIARSDQVRLWLLDTQKSSSLLIMGNTLDASSLFSPLSFLAAELSHLYAETDSTATLSYFCGLHVDSWQDPLANGTGMVSSLLGQLLADEHFSFDLGFVNEDLSGRLNGHDIEALCETFKSLVLQIKEAIMLLCFVDTISVYETRDRQEGTSIVLETLKCLVEETERLRAVEGKESVVFKLLVTDPGSTCVAKELFQEGEVFLADSYIDGGRQGIVSMEGLEPA